MCTHLNHRMLNKGSTTVILSKQELTILPEHLSSPRFIMVFILLNLC